MRQSTDTVSLALLKLTDIEDVRVIMMR